MRVAYVLDKYMIGGGLYFIYRLASKAKDIEFGVFAKNGNNKLVDELKKMGNVKVFSEGYGLAYILSNFQPDVIHVNHLKPLFAILALKKPKIPVIYTARGLHVRKYRFMGGIANEIRYNLRKMLEKYLFAKSDVVVAVSLSDCSFLKNNYGLKNCTYIPNGIEIENPDSIDKYSVREELNLPRDKFLVVTVARFDFQKGYDVLVEGIKGVEDIARQKGVIFVLVGGGVEEERIKKKVKDLGIEDLFIFTGEVPNGKDYIKAADIFLLTSRWEGLPTVVIEAGMLKKPVIASLAPGTVDIVKHEETGVGFENENPQALSEALESVLKGKYDLNKLAQNLHRMVMQNFTVELTMKRYLNLYKKVISSRSLHKF